MESGGDTYLPSLKALLLWATFVGYKLTNVLWGLMAYKLREPLRIAMEVVCDVCFDDPK